jgi:hypothetical protein
MMNPILLAMLTLAMMTGAASGQSRTFYDSRGNVVGRSATDSQGTVTTTDAVRVLPGPWTARRWW